jgi:tyrosine-protein kinase Etk/Wzc
LIYNDFLKKGILETVRSSQFITEEIMPNEMPSNDSKPDLKKKLELIKKHRKSIAFFVLSALILVTAYNIFSKRLYKTTTTIIPVTSNKNNILGQLTGQSILGSLSSLVGGQDASKDKLISILESRTLAENVIQSVNLQPYLFPDKWDKKKGEWKDSGTPPKWEDSINAFRKIVSIKETRRGTIEITSIFYDPAVAAQIANKYIEELQVFINQNSFSFGKRNRVFLEESLKRTTAELAEAENNLKDFQEEHKIITIDSQAEVTVNAIANLKAEILSRDYQLGLLRNTAGLTSSSATKLLEEKKELLRQLDKLEFGSPNAGEKTASSIISMKDFPKLGAEYYSLKRDFLIQQKVFELLTTQLELAKIDELKDQISFEVIDKAKVPMKKYRPAILLNTAVALILSLVLSIYFVLFLEGWRKKIAF